VIFEMAVEVELEFVMVSVRDVDVLMARLPKLREVGLVEREFCAATPVP
jgi:acetolactate synthase regulatory subunit